MAIYHCSVSVSSRSSGSSSVASAAYRSGSELTNERTGEVNDYSRKGGVDFSEIIAPKNAPDWATDREKLWNKVEESEKRKDAQLNREVEVALPKELTEKQMQELVREYAKEQFVSKGMIADINIHHAKGDNPHAHIMLTTREITSEGFGQKNRDWNSKELLQTWRESWEKHANNALEKAGHEQRIDHRTLEAQGIERIPQIHLGIKVLKMEERGVSTERGEHALGIDKTNTELYELRLNRNTISEVINGLTRQTKGRENGERVSGTDRAIGAGHGSANGRDTANSLTPESRNETNARRVQEGRAAIDGQPARTGQGENGKAGASHTAARGANQAPEIKPNRISDTDGGHSRAAVERIVSLADKAGRSVSGIGNQQEHGTQTKMNQPDRTYLAVRRQLNAMGASSYEVGVRNKEGQMMSRTWSSEDVLKAVPWLKRENALGADIYIRPAGEMNQGLLMVDDVNLGGIAKMKANLIEPATVIETSPNNYQAWVRFSKEPMRNEFATAIAKDMAKEYNGDPNSADWRHYGRLAGFTNQKPKHMTEDGKRPWVLAHEAGGQMATRAGEIMSNVNNQWAQREQSKQQMTDGIPKAVQNGVSSRDPIAEFQRQMKGLESRYGAKIDYSTADYMVAVDMARRGFSKEQVAGAMDTASPKIDSRKAGHQSDYVQRTVNSAFKKAQETSQQKAPRREQKFELGR